MNKNMHHFLARFPVLRSAPLVPEGVAETVPDAGDESEPMPLSMEAEVALFEHEYVRAVELPWVILRGVAERVATGTVG